MRQRLRRTGTTRALAAPASMPRLLATTTLVAALLMVAGAARACEPQQRRIVSIGDAVSEIVAALDALCQVVAVDTTSVYPAPVRKLPTVGYMRTLSAEGIVALEPTLVLASDHAGPPTALEQLRSAGVKTVLVPDSPDEKRVTEKIVAVGAALDRVDEARRTAQIVAGDLATLRNMTAPLERPRVLFLLSIARGAPMAAGRDTAADAMIALAGARNAIAGYAGYKPISVESLLQATPDFIVMMSETLADSGGAQAVLSLPGISATPAAKAGRLVAFEGSYLLGMGPRVAHAGRDLAMALHPGAALPALPERPWTKP